MQSTNIEETKDIIIEFAKVNSLLMKLNKTIRYHLSDKSILLDKEDAEINKEFELHGETTEIKQYAYLRRVISTLHDKIFEALGSMSCEDRKTILEFLENKSKNYEAEYEDLDLQTKIYYEAISSKELPEAHKIRVLSISEISKISSRKEEVQGYLISYYSLTHYIEALNISSRIKKVKKN